LRLLRLRLTDFRRFAGKQSLDLNEDVVALVGPNEGGKSSLLHALDLVGRKEVPSLGDVTRGTEGPAIVSAFFGLDTEDRELIAHIPGGDLVTHLWMDLSSGRSSAVLRPEPRPGRDLAPRKLCSDYVEALDGDPGLNVAFSTNDAWPWEPELLDSVMATLRSPDETLGSDRIAEFESLAHRLRSIDYPEAEDGEEPKEHNLSITEQQLADARETAAEMLLELATTERETAPTRLVIEALRDRTPDVAFFQDEDRGLQSSYSLVEVADSPPSSLANLCTLAGIDLAQVRDALAVGRVTEIERIFEVANLVLRDRFRQTWRQSDIYPRLGTPSDGVLRVFVAVEGGGYSEPESRSDGLRWFMALHAFLAAQGTESPILLVDEAETHLHYDAQADLIDALMYQRVARQIVYTTHSVGCLPPDLGCGIRVALAEKAVERSRIANSYWSVDTREDVKVGYTPLLFAMGARLLSLTIPRYGVISEGPADAILLPSLLREVASERRLPYRIVPGLSEIGEADVPLLAHNGAEVVCLTDGDDAGRAIVEKLRAGGMDDTRLRSLGAIEPGCTLEDLVEPKVLAVAINSELETWAIGPFRVAAEDLPETGRWAWLEAKGAQTDTPIKRLSKVRVAQRVVDLGRHGATDGEPDDLVDPRVRVALQALELELRTALQIPKAKSVARTGGS